MEKNQINEIREEPKLNIEEVNLTKKFPFLGFSPSLIDYFLIIGYEIPTKNEIASDAINKMIASASENKDLNPIKEESSKDKENIPHLQFQTDLRPAILNSIGSDFTNAALDEELIIKYMFPNNPLTLYYENLNEKVRSERRKEPPTQNIILYLKANKIYEFDDAHNEKDEKLKNDIMFNVYGFLFWEQYYIEGKDQKKFRIFFPKVFVFISQYSFFKYFSFLSQNIITRIKQYLPYEIPLEVQLYNIVNFTPSPINSYLCLKFVVNKDLISLKKEYTKRDDEMPRVNRKTENKEYKNKNYIFLNQLTGFPFLDINLSSMFLYYNLDMFIIIYIFAFLEIKCLFFSPDLDPLNNIMYILNIFQYPFMELSDLGQIYSISKEEIQDNNKIANNFITGVNCSYITKSDNKEKYLQLPEIYKDYIIIDCKPTEINMFYRGDNMNKYDQSNEIIQLYHYLKRFLNEEPVESENFLETKLNALIGNVQTNFIKYCTSLENDNDKDINKTKEILFKNLNLNEKSNDFKNDYNEMEESNLSIQRSFYSFNICVLEHFHDMMKLEENNSFDNKLTDSNIKAYYDINFRDEEDTSIKVDKYKFTYNEYDKIFFKYFRKTKKMHDYLELFVKKNKCQEIIRQSLLISEEYMNINKSFLFDNNTDYFSIISRFYQTSLKIRKIYFNKFYVYYSEHLTKTIFDIAQDSKVLRLKSDMKSDLKKCNYLYIAKENILDNNILQRYSYILNNLGPQFINQYFPHQEFKNNGNKLEDIGQNLFIDFLESYLIENKIYRHEQVVSFIILIIYIISLKRNKYLFHFFEEIMQSKLVAKKSCLRKYIYFILYLLDEKVKEKIKLNKNYIEELLLYKEIMSTISSLNKKEPFNGYYPNGMLAIIIKNFNTYQDYYADWIKNQSEISEKNKIVIEKYNKFISELLEEGVDYKVFMQNNTCEDKGSIKNDVLIGIAEALEYKGVIHTTCKTCKFKIKPNLFFIHVPNDKSSSIPFCSIIYSYKTSLKILKKILDNNDKGNLDDDYFALCGNMIFYITYSEKTNNLLSRFIATSLK